ncbi:MAG: hypothetical protein ABL949_13400 [Fimbriimonadaceae bacterium]
MICEVILRVEEIDIASWFPVAEGEIEALADQLYELPPKDLESILVAL